jgi:hypothetical protein
MTNGQGSAIHNSVSSIEVGLDSGAVQIAVEMLCLSVAVVQSPFTGLASLRIDKRPC